MLLTELLPEFSKELAVMALLVPLFGSFMLFYVSAGVAVWGVGAGGIAGGGVGCAVGFRVDGDGRP
jgi:hypothetical protein